MKKLSNCKFMKKQIKNLVLLAVILMLPLMSVAQDDIKVDSTRSLTYIDATLRYNLAGYPAITIVTDYGYLEKGDQVAYKVTGENEAVYIVTQTKFNLNVYCFELEFVDGDAAKAKKGGLEYIRINDYKTTFSEEERKVIASTSEI